MLGLRWPAARGGAILLACAVSSALLAAHGRAQGRPVVHALRPGDTVWAISARHRVDPLTLEQLNHLEDVHRLPVGLRLVIPKVEATAAEQAAQQALADALWALRQARFEEALETAGRGRSVGPELDPALAAELDLVSASAEVAFGRREEALAYMRAALRAVPALSLEPSTTSPKIVRLLAEARTAPSSRPEPPLE